jgi:hypothetical protein
MNSNTPRRRYRKLRNRYRVHLIGALRSRNKAWRQHCAEVATEALVMLRAHDRRHPRILD